MQEYHCIVSKVSFQTEKKMLGILTLYEFGILNCKRFQYYCELRVGSETYSLKRDVFRRGVEERHV